MISLQELRKQTAARISTQTHLGEVKFDVGEPQWVEPNVPGHAPIQLLWLRHERDRRALPGSHGHPTGFRGSRSQRGGRHEGGSGSDKRSERSDGDLHGSNPILVSSWLCAVDVVAR